MALKTYRLEAGKLADCVCRIVLAPGAQNRWAAASREQTIRAIFCLQTTGKSAYNVQFTACLCS